MAWLRIDLTKEQIAGGDIDNILKELDFISHKNRGEISENFCVFCSKETPAGRSLYFSPDTGRYTSRIIANYYWTACEEPSENDIDYLLFPTAGSICWSLLKS